MGVPPPAIERYSFRRTLRYFQYHDSKQTDALWIDADRRIPVAAGLHQFCQPDDGAGNTAGKGNRYTQNPWRFQVSARPAILKLNLCGDGDSNPFLHCPDPAIAESLRRLYPGGTA